MTDIPTIAAGLTKAAIIAAAISLTACQQAPENRVDGSLRIALAQRCIDTLPVGPSSVKYNDWDEVVMQCDTNAYYQARGCIGQEAACWAQVREYLKEQER